MKKYNRSEVMTKAWKMYRRFPNLSFSRCLGLSWSQHKDADLKEVSPAIINKVINNLKSINRFMKGKDRPLSAGTVEHFKILNSKIGRRIMKYPLESDSREMLENGELFPFDIIHHRILERRSWNLNKTIKPKRKRIFNSENCFKINIEEYVNNQE